MDRRRKRFRWLPALLAGIVLAGVGAWLVQAEILRLPGQAAATARVADMRAPAQPVAFSHALHAGALGLDCRACHGGAETEARASHPPMSTCAGCHYPGAGQPDVPPIIWQRVNALPEHTYFHHGVHTARGVPCTACHGPVETMERTRAAESFSMRWCLDCHRDPPHGLPQAPTHCHACHR